MPIQSWDTSDHAFRSEFDAYLDRLRALGGGAAAEQQKRVNHILERVREDGDEAVLEFTRRFDDCKLSAEQQRVDPSRIRSAAAEMDAELRNALELAAKRIRRYQRHLLPVERPPLEKDGRSLDVRTCPVRSAGIYVPGGGASLASSVLMNAIPADVAGVERIVMVTPPGPDGSITADRLAAAQLAGVDNIYRIGGAQAIAALAYGTETIPGVNFIAGPGNIYVALAKKSLFGQVGIDLVGGPSEVTIIARDDARHR